MDATISLAQSLIHSPATRDLSSGLYDSSFVGNLKNVLLPYAVPGPMSVGTWDWILSPHCFTIPQCLCEVYPLYGCTQ